MVAIEHRQQGQTAALGQAANIKLSRLVVFYIIAMLMPFSITLGGLLMTPLRFVLLATTVPLIIQLFLGKFGRVLWTDVLFVLHVSWSAVAMAINNPAKVVENIGSTGVEFLGGYLIARACIRDRSDFIALCKFLGIAVLVLFPFTLFESLTGRNLIIDFLRKIPMIRPNNYGFAEPRFGLERAQTVLLHPIHFGMFCSIAFSLTVLGLKDIIGSTRRLVSGAIIGFSTFLSLSSGAFLSLMMQLFLIAWAWVFRNNRRPWFILVGLCVLAYIVVDLLSNRGPLQVFFSYATFSPATAYWRGIIFTWGMKNVWANPLFGLGLNDWVRPFFMYSGSMDNFWLVMAVRFGIPGFLTLAIGYGYMLFRVGKRSFTADAQLAQMRRAWMFTFVGLTFTLCTVHVWTSIYSFVFFMLGSGAWFIAAEEKTADKNQPVADAGTARRGPLYARPAVALSTAPRVKDQSATVSRALPYTRFPQKTRP